MRDLKNSRRLLFARGHLLFQVLAFSWCVQFPALADDSADSGEVRINAGEGSYAVVVSRETYADTAWREAADALVKKHRATLMVYDGRVEQVREALSKAFPRFACFVARPEEADRKFVVALHRMTRALDEDPYTDVFWGILTGYDASDALRIARHDQPLVI